MIPELPQINSLYFDFDGVIADTEQGRYNAYADILKEYSIDISSRCQLNQIQGLTGTALMAKYFPEFSLAERKKIIRRRNEEYLSRLDHYCIPYPGVYETIRDLKAKGFFMALTTANSTAVAKDLLKHLGIAEFFDEVYGLEVCENPVTQKKDYSRIAELTGNHVSECIVIEDSPVGVSGAKQSGYFTIAFEHYPHPDLSAYADLIVHNYNDLRQIFGLEPLKS
ncbi:MAG: HAD family hydrolase [Bacteroidales bacterium]|nr:HAD family hydrolase [Bacteroidales bacterium]